MKNLMSRARLSLLAAGLCLPIIATATSGPAHTGLVANADNAVNANFNPAGLTRIERPEWVGQILYFDSESEFAYTTDSADYPGTFRESSDGSSLVPFIYYARPLSEKLGVGAFLTGNVFNEDLNNDGPSRYRVTDWKLLTGSLVGNLGYAFTDRLSAGFGLSVNYTTFNLKSAVFNPEPDIGDGEMEFDDADVTLSWSAGVLYEFSDTTRAGMTYRSGSDPELSDRPTFRNLGPIRQALIDNGVSVFNRNIGLGVNLPQMVLAGLYHELDADNSVSFDGGWVNFSDFGVSEVSLGDFSLQASNNNFEDIWLGSLGYQHRVNSRWKVSLGAAYVSSGIKDENRTYAFRLDEVWILGVGTEYRFSDGLIFGLNLNYYRPGKGKTRVEVEQPPATLSGEFDERRIFGLDATIRWTR